MTGTLADPILRPTSRILVLDPQDRVLMFFAAIGHSVEPDRRPDATGFWALPGGGVEAGETHEQAALRELKEETGIVADGPMTCIALRDARYPWKGRHYRSLERYFTVRTTTTALDSSGWTDGDRRWMRDLGWWTLDRLHSTTDIVRPPGIAALAQRIAHGHVPTEPLLLPA